MLLVGGEGDWRRLRGLCDGCGAQSRRPTQRDTNCLATHMDVAAEEASRRPIKRARVGCQVLSDAQNLTAARITCCSGAGAG